MTERGYPSSLKKKLAKGEQSMAFGRNTDKFKSGFGSEGSQIVNKRSNKHDFAKSQKINTSQLPKYKISPAKKGKKHVKK
jgi:hypothetical protein